LDRVISYYEALGMSDGSTSDQDAEYMQEFATYAAKGTAVKNAGACFERRKQELPATNDGG
jgi:hypothetical protein